MDTLRGMLALPASLAFVVIGLGAPAQADTLYVPSQYPTIQSAIDAAAKYDEIVVAPGRYFEKIDLRGKPLTLRSKAPEIPQIVETTIIDGSPFPGSVVTAKRGEGPTTLVAGFTITHGSGTPVKALQAYLGGGVFIRGSSPTLSYCLIQDNDLLHPYGPTQPGFERFGGGMAVLDGSPTLKHCRIIGNTAHLGGGLYLDEKSDVLLSETTFRENRALRKAPSQGQGGALYNEGGLVIVEESIFRDGYADTGGAIAQVGKNAVLIVTRSAFVSNYAGEAGGAIDACYGSTLFIDHADFVWNNAPSGGAIRLYMTSVIDPPVIDFCRFGSNEAYRGGAILLRIADATIDHSYFTENRGRYSGAALRIDLGSSPNVCRSRFRRNVAGYEGGAVDIRGASSPAFANCGFEGNFAGHAGGAVFTSEGSNTDFVNCMFGENCARFGGAILGGVNAMTTLCNVTAMENEAFTAGGALYNEGLASVMNSILWGNTGREIVGLGKAEVVYSDVAGGWPGPGNIDIDPRCTDPLGSDMTLTSASPCIDSGHNSRVPPDFMDLDGDGDRTEPTPVDYYGNPRHCAVHPTGPGATPCVDMGAMEFQLACKADLDADRAVGFPDLVSLLRAWGHAKVPEDLDGSGQVDIGDLLLLLSTWGLCP